MKHKNMVVYIQKFSKENLGRKEDCDVFVAFAFSST